MIILNVQVILLVENMLKNLDKKKIIQLNKK